MVNDPVELAKKIQKTNHVPRWRRWVAVIISGDPLIEVTSVKRVDWTEIRKVALVYVLTIPLQVLAIFIYGWCVHPHPALHEPVQPAASPKIIQP